uniref:Alcohol dehydrogenase n=1 Tax=Solanum tuberosum TaxID=4113 RepID=M1B714_SOLTU
MDSSNPKVITCKAAVVWKEGEMIKIEEIQVDPPKSNEVRIKMLFASLCHTDILASNGYPYPLFPRVLGHEGVGMSIHGGQVLYQIFTCATLSEYTVVNANYVIKVDPQKIPLQHASLLCCGFTTGYGATFREVHVEKGSTVAVLGLGAVGLGAIEGARSQGASKIIGVDINELKQGKGKVFGMTDFINPKESRTSVSEMIKDVTEGIGVDYVFECTGIPSMLNEAIEASKLGIGTIVVIGAGHGLTREFNLVSLLCGRTLKGSVYGGIRLHSDLPALLHRCANKEIQLDELITHQVSLTEINQSFELLKDPHCVKIIIKF